MKWLLLGLLLFLVFGGAGRRLAGLMSTVKALPKDFDAEKRRADDPAGEARPVAGRVVDQNER